MRCASSGKSASSRVVILVAVVVVRVKGGISYRRALRPDLRVPRRASAIKYFPLCTVKAAQMSYVLPGEIVPAQHVNLKLGPGLLKETNVARESVVLSTKAGELKHSANNKEWWVESNSWRVRVPRVSGCTRC